MHCKTSRSDKFHLTKYFFIAITWYACRSYIIIFGSSLALDGSIFSTGQAYVALSRCSNWNNVDISHLDMSAFMVDPDCTKYINQ
ncbi:hypothetical protein RhiirA5_442320 [Rhizophagus irregularis]|uniref:Uncharacterized protein n=1 Tax=Rhizophagus irregularis TaxID=588596 RepID=A0A2N0NEV1_9GLOM|nr:hypothetical protein RhiirA5_442320 [Rhizophagus irregularis]